MPPLVRDEKEVFEMANWIRDAVRRLGSALETRQVSPVEFHQARLLGDPVARFDHNGNYGKRKGNRPASSRRDLDVAA